MRKLRLLQRQQLLRQQVEAEQEEILQVPSPTGPSLLLLLRSWARGMPQAAV